MLVTVGADHRGWLVVTWLTRPEPDATLRAFYRRVRPHGPRLDADRGVGGAARDAGSLRRRARERVLGCVLVYAALFGVGELLLRSAAVGVVLLLVSAGAAAVIARNLRREGGIRDSGFGVP